MFEEEAACEGVDEVLDGFSFDGADVGEDVVAFFEGCCFYAGAAVLEAFDDFVCGACFAAVDDYGWLLGVGWFFFFQEGEEAFGVGHVFSSQWYC